MGNRAVVRAVRFCYEDKLLLSYESTIMVPVGEMITIRGTKYIVIDIHCTINTGEESIIVETVTHQLMLEGP